MAKRYKYTITLDFPPATVMTVLAGEAFQREWTEAREEVVEASYEELSRTPGRLSFEVRTTEYARGLTGIDRSRTEQSVRRAEWDLETMRATWTYDSVQTGRFTFRGETQLEALSQGRCRGRFNYFIDVDVPLLGGRVERAVVKELKKGRKPLEARLRTHCAKLG